MPFCAGRVDAENGDSAIGLEYRVYNNNTYESLLYSFQNKGLTLSEGAALAATPVDGTNELSNQYFVELKANDPDSDYLQGDLASIVDDFINDNDLFLSEYARAFNYMVTADLFDGPTKNACQGVNIATLEGQTNSPTAAPVAGGNPDEPTETPSDGASPSFLAVLVAVLMTVTAFATL
mmetsp:Transcript_22274/g.35895  ORF Transcript_22274/g.35895 Transcript_22274/m.35895 type:complete len:179 (-) Transcript_22274:864-1400(-)